MRVRNRVWAASWERKEEKDLGSSAQAREPALSLPHCPSQLSGSTPSPTARAKCACSAGPPATFPLFCACAAVVPLSASPPPARSAREAPRALGKGGKGGWRGRGERLLTPWLRKGEATAAAAASAERSVGAESWRGERGTGPGHDGITATEPWRRPSGRSGRER